MEQLVMSARVVSRSRPQVAALPHVCELLASFLTPVGSWTIERAIRSECRRLAAFLTEELVADPESHDLEKRAYVRECVVPVAAGKGDTSMLGYLAERFDFCADAAAVEDAIKNGQVGALEWLLERALSVLPEGEDVQVFTKRILSQYVAFQASSSGHLCVLQWIDKRVGGFDDDYASETLRGSAMHGHMDIVEWVQPMVTTPLSTSSSLAIAKGGHDDVIRFLHSKSMLAFTSAVMDFVAGYGSLDLLEWMLCSGDEKFTSFAIGMAASTNRVDTIRWLRSKGVSCASDAIPAAVEGGHFEALKLLVDLHPEQVRPYAFQRAVSSNHLSIVQYLFENRRNACIHVNGDEVASGGHLDMIKWLQINCPDTRFTSAAMDMAASNGHLHVVQFLHENRTEGCTTNAMDNAAKQGHLGVVQWLHTHRSEGCTTRAMDQAAAEGHLEVVKFLHVHRSEGCTIQAMDAAGINLPGYTRRRLEVLRWLDENSREGFTGRALENASWNGDIRVLEWFHERIPSDMWTADVTQEAADNCDVETLQWFAERHPETIDAELQTRMQVLPPYLWWVNT